MLTILPASMSLELGAVEGKKIPKPTLEASFAKVNGPIRDQARGLNHSEHDYNRMTPPLAPPNSVMSFSALGQESDQRLKLAGTGS